MQNERSMVTKKWKNLNTYIILRINFKALFAEVADFLYFELGKFCVNPRHLI